MDGSGCGQPAPRRLARSAGRSLSIAPEQCPGGADDGHRRCGSTGVGGPVARNVGADVVDPGGLSWNGDQRRRQPHRRVHGTGLEASQGGQHAPIGLELTPALWTLRKVTSRGQRRLALVREGWNRLSNFSAPHPGSHSSSTLDCHSSDYSSDSLVTSSFNFLRPL
jgi:hypothetical protein